MRTLSFWGMLCPQPHPFSDQESRDSVPTGAAVATVGMGFAGHSSPPGFHWGGRRRPPHLCHFQGHSGRKPESLLLPGLSRVLRPPPGTLVALGHLLCLYASWPAVGTGTRVLASVHGLSHLRFRDGSLRSGLANGSLNVVLFFPFSQAISKSKLRSVSSVPVHFHSFFSP